MCNISYFSQNLYYRAQTKLLEDLFNFRKMNEINTCNKVCTGLYFHSQPSCAILKFSSHGISVKLNDLPWVAC